MKSFKYRKARFRLSALDLRRGNAVRSRTSTVRSVLPTYCRISRGGRSTKPFKCCKARFRLETGDFCRKNAARSHSSAVGPVFAGKLRNFAGMTLYEAVEMPHGPFKLQHVRFSHGRRLTKPFECRKARLGCGTSVFRRDAAVRSR